MYSVISEVERRYISALLRAPQPETSPYLSGRDFQNPAYGAIFDAAQSARSDEPDVHAGSLCSAVAERIALPEFDVDRLVDMAVHGVQVPEHSAANARMIADASFTRQISEAAREAIASATEKGETSGDLRRVGEVLERHAEKVLDGFAAPWPITPPADTDVSERTRLEEQLVASLMVYPQQSEALLVMLPPEKIQDFRCRTAYEYLTGDTSPTHMTSELELRFEIQSRQESYGPALSRDDLTSGERDEAFIYRRMHTDVDVHTGREAAASLQAPADPNTAPVGTMDIDATTRPAIGTQAASPRVGPGGLN
jgi:hypothetical protein